MTEILNWIMDSIRIYGAWSVFFGVLIESVIAPIPSPLVIMGAGFILINSELSSVEAIIPLLLLIVLPGTVGSTIGAYVGYGIGYFGGKPMVDRWGRFLGFGWEEVTAIQQRFRKAQIRTTLFLLRAVPVFPLSPISAAAGFIRLSLGVFTLWTFYGSIPRCFILGYLGWRIGETYRYLARGIDRAETIVSLLLVLAFFGLLIWLRLKMRRYLLKDQ